MNPPQTKVCGKCGQSLPNEAFCTDARQTDGLRRYCRVCLKLNKRKRDLSSKYGLTIDGLHELWKAQDCKCAICGDELTLEGKGRFAVDHNHDTGEVRGILCGCCNTALGKFRDSPVILGAAINYLNIKGSYGREATSRP